MLLAPPPGGERKEEKINVMTRQDKTIPTDITAQITQLEYSGDLQLEGITFGVHL